jgi:hypothetical protein
MRRSDLRGISKAKSERDRETTRAAAASQGSKVKSVHEAKADFRIEFEDGSRAIRARPLRYEIRTLRWNISDSSDDGIAK